MHALKLSQSSSVNDKGYSDVVGLNVKVKSTHHGEFGTVLYHRL